MPKKDMKAALGDSLKAEKQAIEKRFSRAETVLRYAAPDRTKVIRDSFTIPTADYELIAAIRKRCLKAGAFVTKSEVVRAGLMALSAMTKAELLEVVNHLAKVKAGRPKSATE